MVPRRGTAAVTAARTATRPGARRASRPARVAPATSARRGLHQEGEDARRGLEGGEESDQRFSPQPKRATAAGAERVVEERFQERQSATIAASSGVRDLGEDPAPRGRGP